MPGKPTSGNRTARRGKPTRVRRTISKDAAHALDNEARRLNIEADRLLSALVLTADAATWAAVREIAREMGMENGAIPDETGKPIIL